MVGKWICSNCGFEVDDSIDTCPTCSMTKSESEKLRVKAEAERREAERREAERREAERREADRREADRREADRREADRREADRREADRREADRREAERRWVKRGGYTLRSGKTKTRVLGAITAFILLVVATIVTMGIVIVGGQ